MKGGYLFILLLCSGLVWAQSPGGVQETIAWLRCNQNSHVTFSKTQAGGGSDKPYPNVGFLNYNPALLFNGDKDVAYFPVQVNDLSQATVFVVYQETKTGAEQNVWELKGASASLSLTTKKVNEFAGAFSYRTATPGSAVLNTYVKSWKTKKIEYADTLIFGQNENGTAAFKGLIAEYILYDKVLRRSEQRKVETYLAIKYGISLKHDYISSAGKTIWTYKNNSPYNHRITGIGRDEQASLYQRQSENNEERFSISIGAEGIAATNHENNNTINEHDFLIFGDNDGELFIETLGDGESVSVLKRQWIMNVSGKSANTLSTELRIDISKILPQNLAPRNYLLVINRDGSENLSSDDSEHIAASELSKDGILTFKHIFWDTDGSGKDIFSFGLIPANKSLPGNVPAEYDEGIALYPNPSSKGNYTLNIYLKEPAPVQVNIFDEAGRLIQTLSGNKQSRYHFSGRVTGSSGVYSFQITTPYQKTTRQLVVR